jgi:hypothetical protein
MRNSEQSECFARLITRPIRTTLPGVRFPLLRAYNADNSYRYEAEIARLRRELEARGGPTAQPIGQSTSSSIAPPPDLGGQSPPDLRRSGQQPMELDRPPASTGYPNQPPPLSLGTLFPTLSSPVRSC